MQYNNRGSVDPQRAVEYKFHILKKKKNKTVLFWYLVRGLVLVFFQNGYGMMRSTVSLSEVGDGRMMIRG